MDEIVPLHLQQLTRKSSELLEGNMEDQFENRQAWVLLSLSVVLGILFWIYVPIFKRDFWAVVVTVVASIVGSVLVMEMIQSLGRFAKWLGLVK